MIVESWNPQRLPSAVTAQGHETCLDLLRVLLATWPSGIAAGDIAARRSVPPSTLSFHLRALD
jgi:arsenate reductase